MYMDIESIVLFLIFGILFCILVGCIVFIYFQIWKKRKTKTYDTEKECTKKEESDQRVFSKSVADAVISNENTVTTCKVEIETTRQKQENENQCSGRPDVTNLKDAADLHKRCDTIGLKRSTSLRRVNSGGLDFDTQSEFLGGNIDVSQCVQDHNDEYKDLSDIEDDEDGGFDHTSENVLPLTAEDYEKVNKVLCKTYGVNVLELACKFILNGKLDDEDFVIQALSYKIMRLNRGTSSIRYLSSWGCFWASVREIVRARGLVPFLDHFEVPTLLSKFKKQVINMCGLRADKLGKPGLQETNTQLWLDAKKEEAKTDELFVSLSIDGKRIAMRKDGIEDMGGIGGSISSNETQQNEKEEKKKIADLIKTEDRQSIYSVYDTLTIIDGEISRQITGVKKLMEKTSKQASKNTLLNRYLYILRGKLETGKEICSAIQNVQVSLIENLAEKRKSLSLLPKESGEVNLAMQPNWTPLKPLSVEDDSRNVTYIARIIKSFDQDVSVDKESRIQDLGRTFNNVPRMSETFKVLYRSCYLHTRDIFKACGLGANRPVQDMKEVYLKSHSSCSEHPDPISPTLIASMAAYLSPMSFGRNCKLLEVGIKCDQGVSSTPDLLIVDNEGKLLYIVMVKEQNEGDIFDCYQESLATCVMDAFFYKSLHGSILIQYSNSSMVAFSVPRIDSLALEMIGLCNSYLKQQKCFGKRSKETIQSIEKIRLNLKDFSDTVPIMGSYPLVKKVTNNKVAIDKHPEKVICKDQVKQISSQVGSIIENKNKFLAKQARELLAVNVSDISGNPSKHPHTMLAATFLSNRSLKVVGEECLNAVESMIERLGATVINVAVDGELLGLATNCSGQPGTTLALAKFLMKRLMTFSKDDLIKMISRNPDVNLSLKDGLDELDEVEEMNISIEGEQEIEEQIEDSIASIQTATGISSVQFNLEAVEKYFEDGNECYDQNRIDMCTKLKVAELRAIALKFLFPKAKKDWLIDMNGSETIMMIFSDGSKVEYHPNNIFRKREQGVVTISFDMAHLINLCRESAAKGKLDIMGLSVESLKLLSEKKGYEYLKKIIALKNNQLQFDSMNQHASSLLFSDKTVDGLKAIKDFKSANCVEKISNGIIKALDVSGVSSQTRIRYLVALKKFLEDQNPVLERLKRPDSRNITNELYQMILCSIDSHILTYLNVEYFNPRRKSTGSVEQFFGQMTLLSDHGTKLDIRQVQDILSRVMLINALRLLPVSQKGFLFLTKLKVHMKSYRALVEDDPAHEDQSLQYPKRVEKKENLLFPVDSYFDKFASKTKRKIPASIQEKQDTADDGHSRKYHRKF